MDEVGGGFRSGLCRRRFRRFFFQVFQVGGNAAVLQPHAHLRPQKQDVHAGKQPEHENDQSGQAAVDGEVGIVFHKQGEKEGKQHPARRAESGSGQVVQELGPPPGHAAVKQQEKQKQQHKPCQGFEMHQEGGQKRGGALHQVPVDGAAEHQQRRRHQQHGCEDDHIHHRHNPQVQIAPGLFDLKNLVQPLDDGQHAHGGGPQGGNHRHRQHPGGLQGAWQQGLHIGGHLVGKQGLQGRVDQTEAVAEVDFLHQGQQEGHKGQKGDDEKKGPVGRGGVQPVPVHPGEKPAHMFFQQLHTASPLPVPACRGIFPQICMRQRKGRRRERLLQGVPLLSYHKSPGFTRFSAGFSRKHRGQRDVSQKKR